MVGGSRDRGTPLHVMFPEDSVQSDWMAKTCRPRLGVRGAGTIVSVTVLAKIDATETRHGEGSRRAPRPTRYSCPSKA